MKYNDNGTYKDIYVKAFDTLPIGTEVDYDGNSVPTGWTQVNTLIWENEYPTSSFSNQDIALGDTYSKVKIVFKRKSDEDYGYVSGDIYNDNFFTGTLGIASNVIIQRMAKLNGTTLTFAHGFSFNTYGSSSTQNDGVMIPIKVYGYKE